MWRIFPRHDPCGMFLIFIFALALESHLNVIPRACFVFADSGKALYLRRSQAIRAQFGVYIDLAVSPKEGLWQIHHFLVYVALCGFNCASFAKVRHLTARVLFLILDPSQRTSCPKSSAKPAHPRLPFQISDKCRTIRIGKTRCSSCW